MNSRPNAKRFSPPFHLVSTIALLGVPLLAACEQRLPPSSPPSQPASSQTTPLIRSVAGPDLFHAYCASCHGSEARGDGPVVPALNAKVPDLTLISQRNHGQFPLAHVREIILGDKPIPSHGSRAMPVWGPIFHQVEGDKDWGNVRIENLLKYLQTIQSIPNPGAGHP